MECKRTGQYIHYQFQYTEIILRSPSLNFHNKIFRRKIWCSEDLFHSKTWRLASHQVKNCCFRFYFIGLINNRTLLLRLILRLRHPRYITHQARTEDSRTLCGNCVSIKLFLVWCCCQIQTHKKYPL